MEGMPLRLFVIIRMKRTIQPLGAYSFIIDAAHHPHRESKQRAACHQAKSTDDGRQDTAGCHAVCRGARQELPVDDSYTFVYDKTENGKRGCLPHSD